MKCPYCGQEMESGYIQCRDGVVWTPKKSVIPALSFLQKRAMPFSSRAIIAYRCIKCKKIICNYEEE